MTEQMIEAAMKAMREEERVNQNLELGFDDDVYDLAALTIAAIEPFIEGALKDRIEALTAENEALKKSGRALLNAKHKEAAEAKLWFEKGQALTAEIERLKLELGSAKDMFDRHVEWASEQNAVVVCPRAIPPLNYCTDCDGSFPCHLQALEKQP